MNTEVVVEKVSSPVVERVLSKVIQDFSEKSFGQHPDMYDRSAYHLALPSEDLTSAVVHSLNQKLEDQLSPANRATIDDAIEKLSGFKLGTGSDEKLDEELHANYGLEFSAGKDSNVLTLHSPLELKVALPMIAEALEHPARHDNFSSLSLSCGDPSEIIEKLATDNPKVMKWLD